MIEFKPVLSKTLITLSLAAMLSSVAFSQVSRVLDFSAPSQPAGAGATCPNNGTVLLNQTPDQSNGLFSDADCDFCAGGMGGQQAIADNFVITSTTDLAHVIMYGAYFPGDMTPVPADAWTLTIHQDAGGLPGANINVQTVTPTVVATGAVLFGVSEQEFSFDLAPVTLTPGTYWMEITTNSVGNTDSAFWEAGVLDATNGIADGVFATEVPGVTWNPLANPDPTDLAFTLCEAGIVDADLSLALTSNVVSGGSLAPGDQFDLTMTVSNAGPAGATNVLATTALPAAVDFVSSSCAMSAAGQLTFSAGSIASGGTAACVSTLVVTGVGNLSFTGSVAGDQNDPNLINNAAAPLVILGTPQTIPSLTAWGLMLMMTALLVFGGRMLRVRQKG